MIRTRVSPAPIDIAAEMAAIGPHGAVASFAGHVRVDDGVEALFLDHHPRLTPLALERLAATAKDRWALAAVTIVHRVGLIEAGACIVLTLAAARHRAAAIDANAYCIDRLKTDVPLWKRETLVDGTHRLDIEQDGFGDAVVWNPGEHLCARIADLAQTALRAAIREALHGHPLVRKYDSAAPNEGGEGVTVAVLAG